MSRNEGHARQRYVRLRAAGLRRELRSASRPLLAADRENRAWWDGEARRQMDTYRATPDGERDDHAARAAAGYGMGVFTIPYFAVALLILLLLVVWMRAS